MKRVYATKGEEAKRYNFTIPVSQKWLERLTRAAAARGLPRAALARELIEKGLEEKRHA